VPNVVDDEIELNIIYQPDIEDGSLESKRI
jgi:hypothetical protein